MKNIYLFITTIILVASAGLYTNAQTLDPSSTAEFIEKGQEEISEYIDTKNSAAAKECSFNVSSINKCVSKCIQIEKCTKCNNGEVFDCKLMTENDCQEACNKTQDALRNAKEGVVDESIQELESLDVFC